MIRTRSTELSTCTQSTRRCRANTAAGTVNHCDSMNAGTVNFWGSKAVGTIYHYGEVIFFTLFIEFEISPFNMRKNSKMSIADHFEMRDRFFEM